MPYDTLDIGISVEGARLAAIADEFRGEVTPYGLEVVVEKQEESIRASVDWVLPTVVTLWFTNRYLGTMLQEAAKDHYPIVKAAILRLVRRTTGRDREVKLTVISSSPEKATDQDPAAFSVWIKLSDSRAALFRFDQNLSPEELSAAVEEFFTILLRHARNPQDSALEAEPSAIPGSHSTPVVMRFNPTSRTWECWVIDRNGRPHRNQT